MLRQNNRLKTRDALSGLVLFLFAVFLFLGLLVLFCR